VKKSLSIIIISLTSWISLNAQIGGTHSYQFLTLTNSARVAALGGHNVSIPDNDLNFVFHNPSLLNQEMHNQLVMNYINYFSDINYGYISYANKLKSIGNFSAGVHYIHYGEFTETDNTGKTLGNFNASEYCFHFTYSRNIDSLINVGATFKPIYSSLESYNSFGLALDGGISYLSKDKLFSAGIAFRNAGLMLKPYYSGNKEPLPFEATIGLSKKLKHAPFRFSLSWTHLENYNLFFENSNNPTYNVDPVSGDTLFIKPYQEFLENSMRHVLLGVELLLTENFHIRTGYNYQRRRELLVTSRPALSGFSLGVGFKIKKFHFSYGRATYHLAGASKGRGSLLPE